MTGKLEAVRQVKPDQVLKHGILVVATVGYTYPMVRYLQRQGAAMGAEHSWRPTLRRMLLAAWVRWRRPTELPI